MRKGLTFLSLFIACSMLRAQEQYIEVVVTDTMIVEPTEWNYFLFLQKRPEKEANAPAATGAKNNPKRGMLSKATIDSLRAVATTNGGEITGDPENPLNYTLTPLTYFGDETPQYLSVRFTNRPAMEKFIRAVNRRGDLEGRITASTRPDLPVYNDQLYGRIMATARGKAAKLAEMAKRNLGAVLVISEVAEPDKNMYQGLFDKMMDADRSSWLPGWHTGSGEYPTDKIKLEKTLRVRYALQ